LKIESNDYISKAFLQPQLAAITDHLVRHNIETKQYPDKNALHGFEEVLKPTKYIGDRNYKTK